MSYGAEEFGTSEYGGALDDGDFSMSADLEGFGEMTAYLLIQKPLDAFLEGSAEVLAEFEADYVLEAELIGEGRLNGNMLVLLPPTRPARKRAEPPPPNNEFIPHYIIKKRGE
jgi:hypothetical protein